MSVIQFIRKLLGRDAATRVEKTIAKVDTIVADLYAGAQSMGQQIAANDARVEAARAQFEALESTLRTESQALDVQAARAKRIAKRLADIAS